MNWFRKIMRGNLTAKHFLLVAVFVLILALTRCAGV